MVILGQILTFLAPLVMPDQKNNANEVSRWFSDMWVTRLCALQKVRRFGEKTATFAPKICFFNTYRLCRLICFALVVGWLVGGCDTGCSIDRASTYFICYSNWMAKFDTALSSSIRSFLGHAVLYGAQLIFYLKILLSWS